jgi:CRISPR/Cas system-associated protein Cas10 (large subunit of type III CRISPR-Cas system)
MVCNLFSAGGKFLLLAPSSDAVINMLNNVKKEIEKEIHETYFNQFSFLMSFMSIEDFRKKFKVVNFFETADEMFHRLEIEKIRKSKEVLFDNDNGSWNGDRFKASALYEKYQGNGDCSICGKGPATIEDKKSNEDEEGETVRCCFICYRDKFFLGQKLPKCNYIAFGKGFVSEEDEENGEKIVIFHHCRHEGEEKKDCYYVELLDSYKYSDEYYLIYNIGKANEKTQPSDLVTIKKYYANYIPFISNSDSKKKIVSFEEFWKFST